MAGKNKPAKIRIDDLSIKNYKGIDSLELKFPEPLMKGDPDILVMGSRNGLGKTSVLECCSLLLLALFLGDEFEDSFDYSMRYSDINLYELLVRAGQSSLEISANVHLGSNLFNILLSIHRRGVIVLEIKMPNKKISQKKIKELISEQNLFDNNIKYNERYLFSNVFGLSANPLVTAPVLLFHSYRKTQEENPDLGTMVNDDSVTGGLSAIRRRRKLGYARRGDDTISIFKMLILRSTMGRANLFEIENNQESGDIVERLNNLITSYTGGKMGKFRPLADNTLDLRINPSGSKNKETFSFEGLSSGQKEIISTLFLIWYQTKDSPSVVFIDEPELHLNAEWHSKFVKDITTLAPNNQYIIATHSEDIMESVDSEYRALLEKTS